MEKFDFKNWKILLIKTKYPKNNISAIADKSIINYIKELEKIGRESTSYSKNTDNNTRQYGIRGKLRLGGNLGKKYL